jgi:hypothetical protein
MVPRFLPQAILHLETAACTNLPISSLACFFALFVIPSSASKVPGDVCNGSNSSKWPSLVGIVTKAVVLGTRGVGMARGVVKWDFEGWEVAD